MIGKIASIIVCRMIGQFVKAHAFIPSQSETRADPIVRAATSPAINGRMSRIAPAIAGKANAARKPRIPAKIDTAVNPAHGTPMAEKDAPQAVVRAMELLEER